MERDIPIKCRCKQYSRFGFVIEQEREWMGVGSGCWVPKLWRGGEGG